MAKWLNDQKIEQPKNWVIEKLNDQKNGKTKFRVSVRPLPFSISPCTSKFSLSWINSFLSIFAIRSESSSWISVVKIKPSSQFSRMNKVSSLRYFDQACMTICIPDLHTHLIQEVAYSHHESCDFSLCSFKNAYEFSYYKMAFYNNRNVLYNNTNSSL